MTLKDRIAEIYPDAIGKYCIGDLLISEVYGCPSDYPETVKVPIEYPCRDGDCIKCWSQEWKEEYSK